MSAVATIPATSQLVSCTDVSITYGHGEATVHALRDVSMSIRDGESLALRGPSGSGKTTLLHVLGGLVSPSEGEVTWRGRPLSALDAAARGAERHAIALVFQGSNLLPHLTAFENIAFARNVTRERGGAEPEELLELVGLSAKLDALPAELSGGESQRVAIARALAQSPELLLCDEPTGQLDSDTGSRVLNLIDALRERLDFALVVATHEPTLADRYDRTLELSDGRLV